MSNDSKSINPDSVKAALKERLNNYIEEEQISILAQLNENASNGGTFAELKIHGSNLGWIKSLGLKVEERSEMRISLSDFITVSISGWAD